VLAAGIDLHVLQFKVRQGDPRLRAEVHSLDIQCLLIQRHRSRGDFRLPVAVAILMILRDCGRRHRDEERNRR
jgi:hypothetical protein